MRRIILFIIVFCVIFSNLSSTVYAQVNSSKPPLSLNILGKKITVDAPIEKDGIIYLPFRSVAENLGYNVSWYSRLQKMIITKENHTISVTVGSKYAYVNNKEIAVLDYTAIMYNGRFYVPYSFIESSFDYNIAYNGDENVVIISEKSSSSEDTQLIYINNKKLEGDYIPIVKNKKTYIPIRAVGEALGYIVDWYPDTSKIQLTKDTDVISIIINSRMVCINDNKFYLDSNSLLQGGQAFVSIDFVRNILNYNVSIESSKLIVRIEEKHDLKLDEIKVENSDITTNITDIIYDDSYGFSSIRIIGDHEIQYTTFTLNNPQRFVIDVHNAVVKTSFSSKSINKDGISKIRIAQNSIVPSKVVRIVIDLEKIKQCKMIQGLDKKTLSLMYANLIKPITVTKEGDKDVVVISGSNELNANNMKLSNPERVVIDIKGAIHETSDQTIEVGSSLLKSVRIGQFEEGTARVVLDLITPAFYNIKNEGSTIKVYISHISFDFMQYKKLYNTAYVDLNLGTDIEHQVNIDNKNNLLKIIIPKDLEVEPNKYQLNDNLIEYVEVTKQKELNKIQTMVICKMKNLVSYELLSPALTNQIKIKFKYNAQKFNDLTIVIDAGHGGKDSGAVGSDGTTEKELAIDVALRLNKKLKAIGFKTIMTRSDDTYIDKATRVDIANRSYADFFMSIHFNSFNNVAKGIETLYYPNSTTDESDILNSSIADIFQKEVTNALNMTSRGIKSRPDLYVLNKTKMPAILSELGFISNPDELAKTKTEEYRDMAAKALAVSIVKYFTEIQGIDFGFDVQSIYNDTFPKPTIN